MKRVSLKSLLSSKKVVLNFFLISMAIICKQALMAEEVLPVAIIGSGPAGLSAALIAGRERVETHVFLGKRTGGPLNAITCLSNWPGAMKGEGHVVMERLFERVQHYNVNLHACSITQVDFSSWPFRLFGDNGKQYMAKTVIITTGAIPRRLNVPGEEEYFEKGIETSVYKSDSLRFQGKTVAVVGGGIDAYKKTGILSKKAKKVYLIVRRDQMQNAFMEKALKEKDNVEILFGSQVLGIHGNSETITHIDLLSPQEAKKLRIDALVLAAGITPNTSLFADQLKLDSNGFILLMGRTQMTNIRGIYAAGNVTDPFYRQAAISAGDGMKAAYDAVEFLRSGAK